LLIERETDAVGTEEWNRRGPTRDNARRNLKNGEVTLSFRKKLMTLKWKSKGDVCLLSSIRNEEMQTVLDRKGVKKQKLKVCIDFNVRVRYLPF
jgi:hypothetical protein